MSMEELIDECGGFGKYQILVIVGIYIHKLSSGWSMLQMSYAGFIPDWYCVVGSHMDNATFYTNETLEKCSLNNSYTGFQVKDCHSHHFRGPSKTAITEWDLVCDRKWIKATVTSIQMAGVLVGAVMAGQLADMFGRKKITFGLSLIHSLLNFGAAFSISWEMFAAFRFFLGIGIGGTLVATFAYPMEFLPIKWRPLLGILPVWGLGVCIFSISAFFMDNWAHLHFACGALGLPALLGYFYVPESARWLTVKGRYEEAEKTFVTMAEVNGKTPPKRTRAVLEQIYREEQESRSKGREYTYLDLFKGRKQIILSLIFCYIWFTLSSVYYGISFGVSALSGNLYLNIFMLTVVEIPLQCVTFYLNNRYGRKRTFISMLLIGTLPACGCLVVYSIVPSGSRGEWITAFSLAAKMGVGAAWSVMNTWASESYPTVVRSLGYGMVSTAARSGGIVAPFVMDLDNEPFATYVIITSMLVVCIFLSFAIADTKGKVLPDSLTKEPKDLNTQTIAIDLKAVGDEGNVSPDSLTKESKVVDHSQTVGKELKTTGDEGNVSPNGLAKESKVVDHPQTVAIELKAVGDEGNVLPDGLAKESKVADHSQTVGMELKTSECGEKEDDNVGDKSSSVRDENGDSHHSKEVLTQSDVDSRQEYGDSNETFVERF